jgi:hypothetical protein
MKIVPLQILDRGAVLADYGDRHFDEIDGHRKRGDVLRGL